MCPGEQRQALRAPVLARLTGSTGPKGSYQLTLCSTPKGLSSHVPTCIMHGRCVGSPVWASCWAPQGPGSASTDRPPWLALAPLLKNAFQLLILGVQLIYDLDIVLTARNTLNGQQRVQPDPSFLHARSSHTKHYTCCNKTCLMTALIFFFFVGGHAHVV